MAPARKPDRQLRTPKRREATPEEFKAMAHPLRLRILRLCLHDAMTNKELADQLGHHPATVLHHVRLLVDTGFLAQEPARTGVRGSREKPYRATRKSWVLSAESFPDDAKFASELAVIDAFRAEFIESGPGGMVAGHRLGLLINEESLFELRQRLWDVLRDFADRPEDPDGERYGLFLGIHRRR